MATLREHLEALRGTLAKATPGRRDFGDPDPDDEFSTLRCVYAGNQHIADNLTQEDAEAIAAITGGEKGLGVALVKCVASLVSLRDADLKADMGAIQQDAMDRLDELQAAFEANQIQQEAAAGQPATEPNRPTAAASNEDT